MADDGDIQEVRFAAAMSGGVSLAVWMGGLTSELDRLVRVSQQLETTAVDAIADPIDKLYATLISALQVRCVVDVLSGTSAGGINAAALALARSAGSTVMPLRDLWFDEGSIAKLLRDPATPPWPSLLQGDGVLYEGLKTGLHQINAQGDPGSRAPDPVDLFVTTTLHRGELTIVRDDFGTAIEAADHHGHFQFRFANGVPDAKVLELALAARCSASFPLAFEASFVPIGAKDATADHPDMSAVANASASVYTADGGVLANQPVGPALRAIFERPADRPVRRVLAFVVPDPGGKSPASPSGPVAVARSDSPPTLAESMTAVAAAALDHSIATDLQDFIAHNQQVRGARSGRPTLMQCLPGDANTIREAYGRYRTQRLIGETDRVISAATRELQSLRARAIVGWDCPSADSIGTLREKVFGILEDGVPATWNGAAPTDDELVGLGWRTFEKAFSITLDLIRRAKKVAVEKHMTAPLAQLNQAGSDAHNTRKNVLAVWPDTLDDLAHDRASALAAAPNAGPADFVAWVGDLATAWSHVRLDGPDGAAGSGRAPLLAAWTQLMNALAAAAGVANGLDPNAQFAAAELPELAGMLAGLGAAPFPARLVLVDVLETLLTPDADVWEQEVELVQMSAQTGSAVAPGFTTPADKLTGLQVHHFGAFWKRSWRANDWMWGRLDGAGWLVHVLLQPERLRWLVQNGVLSADDLKARLFAVSAAADENTWLSADAEAELLRVVTIDPEHKLALPSSLPALATQVAAGIQTRVLREELATVRDQIRQDGRDGLDVSASHEFQQAYDGYVAGGSGSELTPAQITSLLTKYRVPSERIAHELLDPALQATLGQAVAVTGAMLQTAVRNPIAPLKAALAFARRATFAVYTTLRNPKSQTVPAILAVIGGVLLGIRQTGTSFAGWITLATAIWQLLRIEVRRRHVNESWLKRAPRVVAKVVGFAALVATAAFVAAPWMPVHWHANRWLHRRARFLWRHPWAWTIGFGVVAIVLIMIVWRVAVMIRVARARKAKQKPAVAAGA